FDRRAEISALILIHFQRRNESLLRDFHLSEFAHFLLAGLLLLEQLALAGDVTAVALGQHVLPKGTDGFARNNPAADRRLNGDLEEMRRDELFQFLAHGPAALLGA